MSSIKDVAKRAGVSISTVSNVLNNTKYVSDTLKRKVMIAVEELHYEVDPVARNMKSKKTKTIGVITEDVCGLFYPYVVKGICEIANQKGYNVIICDNDGTYGQCDALDKEKANFKQLISNKVDGIIFVSAISEQQASIYIKSIQKMAMANKKIPLVSVERDFSKWGIDSVYVDGKESAKKAVNHLIDCGCKKIGHITGPISLNIATVRVEGYVEAVQEAGLLVDEDMMIVYGNYTHQSGYQGMKLLLELVPDLDGVFCANDQMAVGAMKALKEEKIKIPEDIKVAGYDNVFISSILEPSLTTIHVKKKHMGLNAARLLFERIENIEGQKEVQGIQMETRLVVRKSTQKDAEEDWILADW